MPRIKILYVNHVAQVSGAERSLLNLVQNLDPSEFEIAAALPGLGPLSEDLASAGVTVTTIDICRLTKTWNPVLLLKYYFSWLRGVAQLTALIKDSSIDIVHANSNTAQIYAGPAAARAAVPCIWHSRDLVNLGPLFPWMSRKAARVIAISSAVEQHLRSHGVETGKLRVIRNVVNTNTFTPQNRRNAALRAMGIPEGKKVVAMIGQMVPWKNHALFIRCAKQILQKAPDTIFAVVGGDLFGEHSAYETSLRDMAEKEIPGKAIFTGYTSDMPYALEAIDILLHPATREPFGRSIIEAMAMEKPVVAVNSCGPAEIISSGTDGLLVPPDDTEAMSEAALSLLNDSTLAERLGKAARKKVESSFSAEDNSASMPDLYREILPEAASR